MMSRRVRRRQRSGGAQIAVVALALLAMASVVASLWWVTRDDPAPSAPTPEQSSPAAVASPEPSESWAWPTTSPAADGEPVAGEGSFVDPASVDRSDPEAVAEAAALLAVSHDTALDDSLTDAQRRMGSLATQTVLDGLGDPQGGGLGGDWLAVAPYRAYSTPAATLIPRHDEIGQDGHDHEAAHPGQEHVEGFEYRVTYQWAGREEIPADAQPEAQTRTVLLTLAERESGWQVVEPPFIETPVGG